MPPIDWRERSRCCSDLRARWPPVHPPPPSPSSPVWKKRVALHCLATSSASSTLNCQEQRAGGSISASRPAAQPQAEEENIRAHSILRRKREKVNRKYAQPHKEKQQFTPAFLEEVLDEDEAPGFKDNPLGRVAHTGFKHDLELEALAERRTTNAKKVHEYSESEREESVYETEVEDIGNSPTHGKENELDEKDGYDEDPKEAICVASMPDEEIEGQEHKRESRKCKAIDPDEQSPRGKPLDHGKAVVFYSDNE